MYNCLVGADRCGGGSSRPPRGHSVLRRRSPSAMARGMFFSLGILFALSGLLLSAPHSPLSVVGAADSTAPGSAADDVYLLNAMYALDAYSTANSVHIWSGMDAAFHASGYRAAGGRRIVIVEPEDHLDLSDMTAVIGAALARYPTLLGILGPYSDLRMTGALASNVLKDNNLMCLAPFTASSSVRVWSDNVYFTRAEPLAELNAAMLYILNKLRAKRIAYMYSTGVSLGDRECEKVQAILDGLQRARAAVYSAPFSETDFAVDTAAFDAMADTNPQVVIVWAPPGNQTLEFARRVMSDPRTFSAVIIGCLTLQRTLHDAYASVAAEGVSPMPKHQILTSATSRSPSDANADIAYMALFEEEMVDYMLHSGKSGYTPPDGLSPTDAAAAAAAHLAQDAIAGQLMVVGWLGGKVIQRTLERVDWITNRTTYQAGLFEQNRYIVGGDAVIGDYGGPCDFVAARAGAMCNCNQGGHSAFLVRFVDESHWTMVEGTVFTYTQAVCYATDVALPKPLNVITFLLSDGGRGTEAARRLSIAIPKVFDYLDTGAVSLNMATLNASLTTQQAVLDVELSNYTVDVLVGPMEDDLDVGDLLVVASLFADRSVVMERPNFISLMPTLEQEIYLLYARLPTIASVTGVKTALNVVLHGYGGSEAAAIVDLLAKTADTFGYRYPTVTNVAADGDAASALSTTGVNLFIGTKEDCSALVAFVAKNPSAAVVMDYNDFALSYDALLPLFADLEPSVRRRFLSFTNMPLWSDTSDEAHAASPLLALFHNLLPDPAFHAPAYLEDAISAAFLHELAEATDVINSTNLVDTLYMKGTLSFYGMVFGQFQWSCTTTAWGDYCSHKNYGAQGIVVLSMERALDPRVPVTVEATTPSMVYTPRRRVDGLSPGGLAAVVVGSVVGGLVAVALPLVLVLCCLVDLRDNDAAPKSADDPVTIMFTDIESSTALWAALPQRMPEAVATHHRVIRSCLRRHRCYEVKTIGDSFMIACKDASSAVQLAAEIQTRLLACDWGTEEIDDAYRRFELQRAEEDAGVQPHSAQLSADAYGLLWRGFRVRMGIHTGLSDIRLDEVTRGFDYYGDASNMAARTEAIANGGQVVMTEAAWWALSDAARAQLDVTRMGPQGLRGVPYAVEMYQLNAVPGREFAALRTEIEAVLPDDGTAHTGGSTLGDPASSRTNMSSSATAVAFVLASCFSTYPPTQRARELQPLLSKWSVPAAPRSHVVSEEDYCQGLINRLAVRVGRVMEARLRVSGSDKSSEAQLLSSVGVVASGLRNPLCSSSGAQRQDDWDAAPSRFVEPPAVGGLPDGFGPMARVRTSFPSPSQPGGERRSSHHVQDGLLAFDVCSKRTVPGGSGARRAEPVVTNAAGLGRPTRRMRRSSGANDALAGDHPMEYA